MKYKIAYLIWFCFLGIFAFAFWGFEWLPYCIFILNILFCAILQQIIISTILKAAKRLDPEKYDSMRSYFYVSRDEKKLATHDEYLKNCIQEYFDLRRFGVADIILVICLIVLIVLKK